MLADGVRAGRLAADHAGFAAGEVGPAIAPTPGLNPAFPIFRHPRGKEFVDFDEDLTIGDIENAVADGFAHPELLKRWSTAGMGPGQGRHSAANVLRITARAQGLHPADLAPTMARPPVTGERFDHLAGQAFHPWRDTPMQGRHEGLGARMMVAGLWRRPASYAAGGEAAIAEEAEAVRTGVGLIDVSTLGKIELRGPDAAAFLDRIYMTPHARQPVGRSRYALLLDDAGSIIDDGVACRFAEDQFYVTATTGQADATYRLLTWFNAQWGMDVDITNLTGAFAAINIAGPLARQALAPLVEGVDLEPGGFPYLARAHGDGRRNCRPVPPRRLCRRARLRDPRPGDPRRSPLGSADRSRLAIRHQALRRRGAAPASPGEGTHHRRPGHRWPDNPVRGQPRLGGAEE